MKLSAVVAATKNLPPARARAVITAALGRVEEKSGENDRRDAAAAFERDMEPIRDAIVHALVAGDLAAIRGLRLMLPALLREVNADPVLTDVFAHQVGKTFIEVLQNTEEPPTE